MATLEQVEKLREKANVSYDEAKEALDHSNGDLLDAMIYLEKQGKVKTPEGGGRYSSSDAGSKDSQSQADHTEKKDSAPGESFGELVKRLIKFCCRIIRRGNINNFEIYKDGERKASFPITLLVVMIVFAFWISFPLLIIGLFFGLRYRFNGPDFHKSAVNNAMDTAAEAAESIKKSLNSTHN